MSPSIGQLALCSRFPAGPSGTVFLISCVRCSKSVPCVSCVFCCNLVLIAVGISVGGNDPQPDWLWGLPLPITYKLLCGGTEPTEQDSPQWALVSVEMTHWGYHLVGHYWVMLCCGLKSTYRCVSLGASWEGL